jgi:hypothetical protein
MIRYVEETCLHNERVEDDYGMIEMECPGCWSGI